MKKILFAIFSTLLLISCSDDLKFVCTDMSFSGNNMSSRDIQDAKDILLGFENTLHFYDNSIRWSANNGESLVMDKRPDGTYEYTERKNGVTYRLALILERWLGYIKGFTVNIYIDSQLEIRMAYKRDNWFENVVDIFDK